MYVVCMYAYMNVWMNECMYLCMYECIYAHMNGGRFKITLSKRSVVLTDFQSSGSWVWKRMIKLRPFTRLYLLYQLIWPLTYLWLMWRVDQWVVKQCQAAICNERNSMLQRIKTHVGLLQINVLWLLFSFAFASQIWPVCLVSVHIRIPLEREENREQQLHIVEYVNLTIHITYSIYENFVL